jgi:hypothetical protein
LLARADGEAEAKVVEQRKKFTAKCRRRDDLVDSR